MSISIDKMIASGATLPEIQAELRKQVAARDEVALAAKKREQARDTARNQAVAAMMNYFKVLGIPDDELDDILPIIEETFKITIDPLESLYDKENTSDADWLKSFVASL